MYVSKHIDWLSITFQKGTDLQRIFGTLDWHYDGRGRFGYQHAYRDKITGAMYQEGNVAGDMGVHLTLSGDALNSLRSQVGSDDDALARICADWHGHASRLDLTLNIHEGQITPRNLYSAVKIGRAIARSTTYRYIQGSRENVQGDTLYLGAPKSDQQFRCYNKAAELGIVDKRAWIRLELELRRLRADNALRSCRDNGVSQTVGGHIGDFLLWNNPEYQLALGDRGVPPACIPRKDNSRRRWLLGQVAQALAKEIRYDVEFRALFDRSVEDALVLLG